MKIYTICLIGLQEEQIVVIGGGGVAARKVAGLLTTGAQVKIISPTLGSELQSLVDTNAITFVQRPYQNGDLEGAYLAVAATDNLTVNKDIWAEAKQRGCLINVVDDPKHSNFILPAIIQHGDLSIAISTGGGSPALARRLRERLENIIGPEYGILVEVLAELRPELLAKHPPGKARLQAALRIIDSETLHIIQTQGKKVALTYARDQLHQ